MSYKYIYVFRYSYHKTEEKTRNKNKNKVSTTRTSERYYPFFFHSRKFTRHSPPNEFLPFHQQLTVIHWTRPKKYNY